jgi:NAD(P)H-dependent FMN reductase
MPRLKRSDDLGEIPIMKVLAFAASNSHASNTCAQVEHAVARLYSDIPPSAEVEFIDLNDYEMPVYSINRQRCDGSLAQARSFFDTIVAADTALISYVEHNGSITAAWKKIFAWMSRIEIKFCEPAFPRWPAFDEATAPEGILTINSAVRPL